MSAAATPLNPLVAKIRAAHPGAYDDLDDAELTKRVLAKYPQYSDLAGPGVPKPPNPIEQEIKSKPLQYTEGKYTMPGSFEGHPENIGEYIPSSVGQMASGVKDIGTGEISRGTHKVISGVGNAMLPVTPFVAAAAPMATARAIGGGMIGGKVASGLTSALGGSEDQQELASDIGNIVGGGVGVKAPEIAMSATRKVLPRVATAVDPDITGLVSPRLAHLQRVAGRLGDAVAKPEGIEVKPELPERLSPTAEHLQNRIQIERGLRAQEPFPKVSEGLPEVQEGQAAATEHLHNAVQPHENGNFRMEQTPRRMPGEIAAEAVRPRAHIATSPEPIPARKGLMLPGEVTDTRPAKVGALLNEATGGKPLNPKIPLKGQLSNVTPVTVPKESSVVESHSYNPSTQELTVKTKNGGEYVHGDVSPEQAKAFATAESKGKAWNDIRNNSTLVAKVVNGKRVAIKPSGPRIATPNDLTPILKESVEQAKSSVKPKPQNGSGESGVVQKPVPQSAQTGSSQPKPKVESPVAERNRLEAQRINEQELAKGTKADQLRRRLKAEGHGEEYIESYIKARPEEVAEPTAAPAPAPKIASKPKATKAKVAGPAEKLAVEHAEAAGRNLEKRALAEGAQPLSPRIAVPKEGKNFEGRYVRAALEPAQEAWKGAEPYGDHQISWAKDTPANRRDGLRVNMHDPNGNYVASLEVKQYRDGYQVLAKGGLNGSKYGTEAYQVLDNAPDFASAKRMAEERLRTGQVYDPKGEWQGRSYGQTVKPSEVTPHSNIDPSKVKRPAGFDTDKLLVKVPGDGTFVVNNRPSAIAKAIKVTDNFVPEREPASFARRIPKSPAEFNAEAHITALEREIAGLEDKLSKTGRYEQGRDFLEQQLQAARESLADAKAKK